MNAVAGIDLLHKDAIAEALLQMLKWLFFSQNIEDDPGWSREINSGDKLL
ncbi:hypothetical protein [Nitrosovibrio tenuis]|uniref:Uncharacterized protein n=1 Tax=Nitrosovibrio tenuis TaxID=1233 RepID=A0A1H7I8R6_9PROT|nr:hypothetical protein [Nitrosovibrio tenuis]SEK58734.1 hypothetical protein SAMN05216387_10290 [Nitrosovibrio tenuis]